MPVRYRVLSESLPRLLVLDCLHTTIPVICNDCVQIVHFDTSKTKNQTAVQLPKFFGPQATPSMRHRCNIFHFSSKTSFPVDSETFSGIQPHSNTTHSKNRTCINPPNYKLPILHPRTGVSKSNSYPFYREIHRVSMLGNTAFDFQCILQLAIQEAHHTERRGSNLWIVLQILAVLRSAQGEAASCCKSRLEGPGRRF